jgi:hypothetical protein
MQISAVKWLLFMTVVSMMGPFCIFAQNGPGILWQKTYGGYWNDWGNTFAPTSDGGYIIAGSTSSDLPGYHTGGVQRPPDYFIIKISSTGNIEWQQVYGGTDWEALSGIIQTSDGGYAVIGMAQSSDGDIINPKGLSDLWVLKLTPTGSIEWQKTLGGSSGDNLSTSTIIQVRDGGFIVGGTTYSTNGDVSFNHGAGDAWVVKLTPAGTIVWEKTFGGSGYESLTSIVETKDSNYVFAGTATSNNGDVSGTHGNIDIWVAKINKTGTLQWQKAIGGSNGEYSAKIIQANDGGYTIVGNTGSTDGDVTYNRGQGDLWVVKLNSTGNLDWQKTYGGSNADYGFWITQQADNTYVISGSTESLDGDVASFHHGARDVWILQISPSGKLQWQQTYGGSQSEDGASIFPTPSGYAFIATTNSNDKDVSGLNDTLTLSNPSDLWFVELCQQTGYSLSASAVNFGNVPLCTYRDTIVEIHDTGCYTLFIDSVKMSGSGFQLLKRPKNKLAMDKVDTFLVRYQPLTHGISTGIINLYYNERGIPKTIGIPFSATGAAGEVNILSSIDSFSYNFPLASACSQKDSQYITLKNIGCDTIKILNVTFLNDGATLVGSRIGPTKPRLFENDTLLFRWIITPSIEGIFQAKIVIKLGFPDGSTQDTILTANAVIVGEGAELVTSLNQAPYQFASRPACTKTDSVRFTIGNLGCDTLNVINVIFSNSGTTLIGSGPTTGVLIGKRQLTYRWLLNPQQPGSYSASVTITYRLPDGTTHDTTFSASATVSAGAPLFSSSLPTASYTFPSRSLCAGNDTAQFTIHNGGCDTLDIVNVRFTNSSELAGIVVSIDSSLAGSDSVLLQWIFDPSLQGNYTGYIIITYRLPDGTEHDTTITVNATVLPGDALLVSSLGSADYTFSSLPACGNTDSVSFSVKNPGCDTLSIINIAFANAADILVGSQGTALTGLVADDSIVFTWLVTATTPGTYQASIKLTYKLPDGSQHDTTFTAQVTITPGSKSLTQSLTAIDYGPTFICQTSDTTITFTNDGCDTLTVYGATLGTSAFTYSASPPLPRSLQKGESIQFTIGFTGADTTGHPLSITDMFAISSTADNVSLQIPLTRDLTYPVQFGLALSAAQSAENLKTATYTVSLTGTPPSMATVLYFDVIYNSDLLKFSSLNGPNLVLVNTSVQGEMATSTFAIAPVPGAAEFGALTFLAYLSKVDSSIISIDNVHFDMKSNIPNDCIATVEMGTSTFRYDDVCGEPAIRSFMQGNTVFNIIAIRPQPMSTETANLYLDLDMNESNNVTVSYRNILGAKEQILVTNTLHEGRHSLPIDISKLHEGVYFLTIEAAGQTETKKIIVH